MEILEYVLVALGAIGLTLGYRRNLLLASALTLSVALGMTDFIAGVQDGYHGTVTRTL